MDAARWIITHQMGRRNLSDGQKAMMGQRLANLKKHDNQHTKQDAQICATSQSDAAEMVGVSRRSVQHAAKVIAEGSPALIAAVDRGDVAVSAAAEQIGASVLATPRLDGTKPNKYCSGVTGETVTAEANRRTTNPVA